jgi:tetratricopeptide (TPR) repeat protein
MKQMFLVCLVFAGIGVGGLAGSMLANRSKDAAPAGPDPAIARALSTIETQLDEMKQRLVTLEQHPAVAERVDVAKPGASGDSAKRPGGASGDDGSGATTSGASTDAAAAAKEKLAATTKELEGKFAKLALDGVPRDDLRKLLGEIAKNGQQEAAVAAAKALVEKNPSDSKAHYLLGEAYYAQLSTSGSIASYQTIGPLTLGEWEKASELDPKYWDPKFEHAVYLTYVPESVGMTSQVISEFESLIEQQNGSTSNPQYAQSYAHLARMYLRVGKKDKALQTLRDGTALFPDDAQLKKQLEVQEKN